MPDAPPLPREIPVFFTAGGESLFGIVAEPATGAGTTGVVIVSGGLTGTSTVGRNQLYVWLARQLAADGFPSIRFDYHGMGESTGRLDEFRLDTEEPFVDDILAAAHCLRGHGVERIVLLGKCFGSRMALAATGQIGELDGVVLIGPPVRDFGKGERTVVRLATELTARQWLQRALRPETVRNLADKRRRTDYRRAAVAKGRAMVARRRRRRRHGQRTGDFWVSSRFVDPLWRLAERRVPVQLVYGDDNFYRDFRTASRQGALAELLGDPTALVTISEVPGLARGFVQGPGQEAIIGTIRSWLRDQVGDPSVHDDRAPSSRTVAKASS